LSGILNKSFGKWNRFFLQVRGGKIYSVGSLRNISPGPVICVLFLRDPIEQVSPSLRLKTETDPISEKLCFLVI
jgi:hypothetical protein